ncbi:MAG: nicotinamide-nucleotide amidohydrolase family protein, partial [Aquificae bacterium]|nr:nicotinamide-nucleotide amidohydrolase family protein [Aquificota bacterium]
QYGVRVALDKAELVVVCGGTGGTDDDLTREAVAEAIGVPLIFDKNWLERIKRTLKEEGKELTENIKKMAKIPYGAKIIENPVGKAVGFIKVLDDVNKAVAVVPGVPSEMKPMVVKLFDMVGLKGDFSPVHLFRTFGKTELEIDRLLSDIDNRVITASPKGVDIFLLDKNRFFLENKVAVVRERLGRIIYTEREEEMEEVVGRLLRENGLTVSTAESSTGGLIASRIVNVAGSSAYLMGGVVSYSNEAKINVLGVNGEDIKRFGAVSEVVARQMVEGAKRLFKTDVAVSDTGIAGPSGGSPEKPVGLHYIGYSDGSGTKVDRVVFKGDRNDIRLAVSQYALNLIRLALS